ncbi:MAG: hypothetical protein ABIR79_25065 [Candidatus Binatia bacterium]
MPAVRCSQAMVPLLLAAMLWHAPATLRVPNGESRTLELPAVAGPARLVFRAHAEHWRPAGSNPLLRILVNDQAVGLMRDRRTARLASQSTSVPARHDALRPFDFGRWRVPQGPVASDEIAIDVSDLLTPDAPARLTLEAAPAGSLGPTPLVIDDLRLESAPPVVLTPPSPDWRTPRLDLPAPPRFEVESARNRVLVSWQGEHREIRTVVTGGAHDRQRQVERFADRIEVRDTITNTTDAVIGLHVRHAVVTDASWLHLGGRPDPDVADAYSPWNPTVFTPVGSGGLGLVAEDDVFRQQLFVDFEVASGTIGMRTDLLCLAPGERQTMVWSIYPVRTPSYWDFINAVRADWRVNRTVPGSFIWFTPDAILGTPPDKLRTALARQGTAVASMFGGWVDPRRSERPPVIGFGTAVLGATFAPYRERLRRAVQQLKDARPGVRVLLYFDSQRDSSPDAARRFADSLLVGLDGRPESVDWAGEFTPSLGMVPTAGNSYGRALREVVAAMRELGADGLYWDEMDGVDYRAPRVTTHAWDGRTCALAADGTVEMKLGLVNLLSDAVKSEYADTGMLLGNVPPTTRRFTERADLRMVEAESSEPWGPMAHLTTPLAYIGNRRDAAMVLAKIDEGLLPAGARIDVAHEIVARLFPFTPEYLQPGTLRGRERIVTTESGTHGWRTCPGAVRAFRYDGAGHEHPADWHVKHRRAGAYVRVRLALGEAAILECDRPTHD